MSDEKKGDDNDFIIIISLAFLSVLAVGYFLGDYIKFAYLTFKLYEIKIAGLIYMSSDMQYAIDLIENKHVPSWKWSELIVVGKMAGYLVNWVFAGIFIYFIYKIYKLNPYNKLTRSLDMLSLMESEKKLWPYLIPIMHLNLLKEKLDSGKYAMAMKPLEFVNKFKLLDRPKDLTSLNKMKTEKLLSSQLGKLFDNVDNLNSHCRALFGIFAAQAMGESWADELGSDGKPKKSIEEAREVVKKLAESTAGGKKPNYKYADKLVERYKNDERVLKIIQKNAYVYTALGSLYQEACKKGVLPPNNLLWLKFINRPLFYFLNCVGRKLPYIEVAGIFGHWKAENVCKHPIEKPFVIKAREGIEKALQEVKLVDN